MLRRLNPEFRAEPWAVAMVQRVQAGEVGRRRAEDRAAILAALGGLEGFGGGWYSTGRVFQCGRCQYPYVIGECGGAMEEAQCPGCRGVIGGRDHRLAEGNVAYQGPLR